MNKAILHVIVIYTLATCPFCIKAKKLLDEKGVSYEEIEISKFTNDQKEALFVKCQGSRTVPQIFIDGVRIGGFSDLSALDKEGKLDKLLKNDHK